MGFTPSQMGAMSLWEFGALAQAYRQANSAPAENEPKPPSFEEHLAAVEFSGTLH